MDRRRWASQVVDLVNFDVERERDVVAHHLEVVIVEQMGDVCTPSGEVVVNAEYIVPFFK
jgi:hypothetical protein